MALADPLKFALGAGGSPNVIACGSNAAPHMLTDPNGGRAFLSEPCTLTDPNGGGSGVPTRSPPISHNQSYAKLVCV